MISATSSRSNSLNFESEDTNELTQRSGHICESIGESELLLGSSETESASVSSKTIRLLERNGDGEQLPLNTTLSSGALGCLSPQPPAHLPFSLRQQWYTAVMLALTTTCLFADQNLMAPNLTAIAESLGMSQEERDQKLGGELALGFFLVGAPVALLVGYLTDTMERRLLFLLVVLFGEVPCLLTYWVEEYWQLFVLRMLTGISIGGALPLIFSVLGDLFPASHRSEVSCIPGVAMGLGQLLGQSLAGFLGPTHGWRLPFVLVACPTMAISILFFCTTREPPRGISEAGLAQAFEKKQDFTYRDSLNWGKFRAMWLIPTNQLVFAQAFPGCVPWGVMLTYFNDYLAQEKGMGVVMATNGVMTFGLGSALGTVAGGIVGQRFYNLPFNNGKARFACFIAVCTFAGILPVVVIINMPSFSEKQLPMVYMLLAIGGALASVSGSNVRAVLLNVNAPETRGTVFAFYNLMDDLGKGLGPGFVALLITFYGRLVAFNIAMWAWALCALFQALLSLTLHKDEQALQKRLANIVNIDSTENM